MGTHVQLPEQLSMQITEQLSAKQTVTQFPTSLCLSTLECTQELERGMQPFADQEGNHAKTRQKQQLSSLFGNSFLCSSLSSCLSHFSQCSLCSCLCSFHPNRLLRSSTTTPLCLVLECTQENWTGECFMSRLIALMCPHFMAP